MEEYKEKLKGLNLTDLDVAILTTYINEFIRARETYTTSKVSLFIKLQEYNINPRKVITDWDNKI